MTNTQKATTQNVAISIADLHKRYGDNIVLDGIDLKVAAGEVFCLLGPNGAGKTTMINILTTLSKADRGRVTVGGFDVVTQADKVRRHISLTGQFAAVDDILTARENLTMIGELRHVGDPKKTARELLDKFDLAKAADRRTATFSGGMRRRLDVAMSLIGDPSIIFLDEPTTGLDPEGRNTMWVAIKSLVSGGETVFLTTQYLEEADQLADRIAILHHGNIAAEGTAKDLKDLLPHGQLELQFHDAEQLDIASKLFAEHTAQDSTKLTLTLITDGSVAQMANIFSQIQAANLDVAEFSQKAPTLDDAFLNIINGKGQNHEHQPQPNI